MDNCLKGMSKELEYVFAGLWEIFFERGEDKMRYADIEELTPEFVEQRGKKVINHFISVDSYEERLKDIPTEERLKGVPTEERLKGVPTEERLKGVPTEEFLKRLTLTDRLSGLSEEELQQLKDKLSNM